MIDTHKYIQLSIVHEQDLQHALNQCSEVSVPLPQSLVFSLEQLSVKIMTDDDTEQSTHFARLLLTGRIAALNGSS
jgi:hypothetical protein